MKFTSSVLNASEVQSFLSAGFSPTLNDGDAETEVYLTKKAKCEQLPYVLAHIVDENLVFPEDECSIDVLPDGSIQLVILAPDYLESYSKTEDFNAWAQMAKDAGVVFN